MDGVNFFRQLMKVFIFILFALPLIGQTHIARLSVGTYYEQVDFFKREFMRINYPGVEVSIRHSLKDNIKWLGTDFGLSYDTENELVFNFGLTIRKTIYNNFFGLDLILPRLNMPLDGFHLNKYNTPYGFSLRIFPSKVNIKYTGLVFNNAIVSRLSLNYSFY